MAEMKEISILDIPNIHIGHAQDYENGTGCTVIRCDGMFPCGTDVRGGGPASRETELLNPTAGSTGVNAVVLSGGSAYGLDAAAGVMKYLEEHRQGVPVGDAIVPLVVQSCIFDLNCQNSSVRPDGAMGYKACVSGEHPEDLQGNVGAGTGATVGKLMGDSRAMKSGLGTYAVSLGELQVGAIVAVNAIGDVYEMDSGTELAGLLSADGTHMISTEDAMLQMIPAQAQAVTNTTIAAIVTNARLDKAQMKKVAQLASNGIARTIRPVNTSMDGDTVYALSCGNVISSSDLVGTLGAHVLAKAINRAVREAKPLYGYRSARSF